MADFNLGKILVAMVMIIITLTAFVGNGFLFFVVIRSSNLRIKPSNAFVLSIFLVGFLSAIVIMPLALANYWERSQVFTSSCGAIGFCNSAFVFTNVFQLFLVTMDRYFAIVHPMTHTVYFSLVKSVYSIACAWTLAIVLAALPFTGWSKFVFDASRGQCGYLASSHESKGYAVTVLISVYAFPSTVILLIYALIFREANIVRTRIRPCSAVCTISGSMVFGSSLELCKLKRNLKSGKISKAAKTLTLLLVHYLVCYVPDVVVQAVTIWGGGDPQTPTSQWTLWLNYSSFATQPIFYGIFDRSIRKEMVRYFRYRKKKRLDNQNWRSSDVRRGPMDFNQFLNDTAG